jgi:hypothetical protein
MPWRLVLLSKFRSRLSTAHLIALVALFFAIGGRRSPPTRSRAPRT